MGCLVQRYSLQAVGLKQEAAEVEIVAFAVFVDLAYGAFQGFN